MIVNNDLNTLKEIVLKYLGDQNVKVILFGSRARGDNTAVSDIDIGIVPKGEFDRYKLSLLNEYIDEHLNIPYKVDVVDFSIVSEIFKKVVLSQAITWKN